MFLEVAPEISVLVSQTVPEFSSVTIQCTVRSNPESHTKLQKPTGEEMELRVQETDDTDRYKITYTFDIDEVTVSDWGNYTCRAENGLGDDVRERKKVTTLFVEFAPEISDLVSQTVPESSSVTIQCTVRSNPESDTKLLKPTGEEMELRVQETDDTDRYKITYTFGIDEVTVSDWGNYTCRAENGLGDDVRELEKVTTLFVESSPRVCTAIARGNPRCRCNKRRTHIKTKQNITAEVLKEKMEETKKQLTRDRAALSSYISTKISATDNRPSCISLGFLGIVIIIIAVAFVVSGDVIALVIKFKLTYFQDKTAEMESGHAGVDVLGTGDSDKTVIDDEKPSTSNNYTNEFKPDKTSKTDGHSGIPVQYYSDTNQNKENTSTNTKTINPSKSYETKSCGKRKAKKNVENTRMSVGTENVKQTEETRKSTDTKINPNKETALRLNDKSKISDQPLPRSHIIDQMNVVQISHFNNETENTDASFANDSNKEKTKRLPVAAGSSPALPMEVKQAATASSVKKATGKSGVQKSKAMAKRKRDGKPFISTSMAIRKSDIKPSTSTGMAKTKSAGIPSSITDMAKSKHEGKPATSSMAKKKSEGKPLTSTDMAKKKGEGKPSTSTDMAKKKGEGIPSTSTDMAKKKGEGKPPTSTDMAKKKGEGKPSTSTDMAKKKSEGKPSTSTDMVKKKSEGKPPTSTDMAKKKSEGTPSTSTDMAKKKNEGKPSTSTDMAKSKHEGKPSTSGMARKKNDGISSTSTGTATRKSDGKP
ncbi:ribosome-binding protein 1-like [Pecten maximus]|uniref:ribosome-binding protein 1-like n=1 Tax=Pecten maximus TaxID=6579 RepID=UPI00145810BC|nr:ribosome-binding protein 1-like [Pecten maximus]